MIRACLAEARREVISRLRLLHSDWMTVKTICWIFSGVMRTPHSSVIHNIHYVSCQSGSLILLSRVSLLDVQTELGVSGSVTSFWFVGISEPKSVSEASCMRPWWQWYQMFIGWPQAITSNNICTKFTCNSQNICISYIFFLSFFSLIPATCTFKLSNLNNFRRKATIK